MSLLLPAQTALISAITAGFVTLVVEYAAKPRLEVRKNRIVEYHRARREMLARLIPLSSELSDLMMLVYPHSGWMIGKRAFDVKRDECEQLYNELCKFSPLLGKRQREVVENYVWTISARIKVIDSFIIGYETSGYIEFAKKQPDPLGKVVAAPVIEDIIRSFISDIDALHEALLLTRARPWSYYRRLQELTRRHDEIDDRLRNRRQIEEPT